MKNTALLRQYFRCCPTIPALSPSHGNLGDFGDPKLRGVRHPRGLSIMPTARSRRRGLLPPAPVCEEGGERQNRIGTSDQSLMFTGRCGLSFSAWPAGNWVCLGRGAGRIRVGRSFREAPCVTRSEKKFPRNFPGVTLEVNPRTTDHARARRGIAGSRPAGRRRRWPTSRRRWRGMRGCRRTR